MSTKVSKADMAREGKLERLAEFKESRLLTKLQDCALRYRHYNISNKSFICSRVGGPDVEEAEYRNCSQSFLRGLVLNSFIEEIEKGTDPQLLLSQKNIL